MNLKKMKFERPRGKNIGEHKERLGNPKAPRGATSALPRRSSAPSPTNGNEPQILMTTRHDMILTSDETPLAARDAKGCPKGGIKGSSSWIGSYQILILIIPIILILLLQSPSISFNLLRSPSIFFNLLVDQSSMMVFLGFPYAF